MRQLRDLAFVDAGGKWILPVMNCPITKCCIDYAVALRIECEGSSFELRIENDFTFVATDGTEIVLSPENQPAELGPILSVVRTSIEQAVAFDDGCLAVSFADGSRLHVPASLEYESWQLVGPGGLRIISTPGGELAIWDYQP